MDEAPWSTIVPALEFPVRSVCAWLVGKKRMWCLFPTIMKVTRGTFLPRGTILLRVATALNVDDCTTEIGVQHTVDGFHFLIGHGVELPFAHSVSVEEDAIWPGRLYELLNRG